MSDSKDEVYPKIIGLTKCPRCGAEARRQLTAEDSPDILVLCDADKEHNYRETRARR